MVSGGCYSSVSTEINIGVFYQTAKIANNKLTPRFDVVHCLFLMT